MAWMEYRDEYLDEMLQLEGRGEQISYTRCASCEDDAPLFRCANQVCHGPEIFCGAYIVRNQSCLPIHWIELGHPPGYSYPTARAAHKDFVVIDITGIHNVRWWLAMVKDPQTCATFAVVQLFQIVNCLGKVSAYDFVRSLELLTNNDGLTPPPVQFYSVILHIVRQYRMMLMMKRAGRGHSPSGVLGTVQGELALHCWACPQDGRNLPDGWNNINWDAMPEDLRYKYFLFLAQDCNFHLINRNVSTAAKDLIIDDGLWYFAMFLANKKRVKGLCTTGVGGVMCARHNMWRPNGIGDLQLGERYCNMDFILFSAIFNVIIFYLILSYDIACQYGKNFWSRMPGLPSDMHLPASFPMDCVWFKVPNFHLPPHKPLCHSLFSFHWMWGAGRTHGETVEQNWEFTNGAAASTKMMGLGTRHATL
ncbi:hypothetical protein C8R45DRAFT_1050905 [Mycena sanguinolenta]|nr:hypothetical protein C8R45DRAFT_1050905 [Mycena sanguinolenta]